jgi:hypothetical protein
MGPMRLVPTVLRRAVLAVLVALLPAVASAVSAATSISASAPAAGAGEMRLVPGFAQPMAGPHAATGAVIWSHGRSLEVEDSTAPTPAWLAGLRDAGWDVWRFERPSLSDSLPGSSQVLAGWVGELRRRGYRHVVLAGQSFGAVLSLMAASAVDGVDAVLATAPAAFGSFSDSQATWRLNASRLYPLLETVRVSRVMMFFFHGDEFDPGGRAERAEAILARRGLDHVVIDQPADLPGHGAAGTGLFVRRFGDCIVRFLDPARRDAAQPCEQPWGQAPSAQMAAVRSGSAGGAGDGPRSPFAGRWYGFYLNGREVVLTVEPPSDGTVTATYALGPGVVAGQQPETTVRRGRQSGSGLVFDEAGLNPLEYRLRADGRLAGTWRAADGTGELHVLMQRID